MFDKQLAEHIANLSMLCFSPNESETIIADMNSITKFTDKVRNFQFDTDSYRITPNGLSALRSDTPNPSYPQSDILKNSDKTCNDCFTVPKIV